MAILVSWVERFSRETQHPTAHRRGSPAHLLGFGRAKSATSTQPTRALLLASTLALAGCGTTGVENAALATAAIPQGKARVTISRVASIVYSGAPATITLNGTKVADLGSGGSTIVDVPAGANTLTASAWSYPGTWTLKLDARAGQRYTVEVAPREASIGPGMLGPIGGMIDASQNANAGAFQLRVVGNGRAGT